MLARRTLIGSLVLGTWLLTSSVAEAQYPQPIPPPQPPPPGQYQPQQRPPQYYPPQPQPQYYPPQQPGYYPAPQNGYPLPASNTNRSSNEMLVLYGAAAGYGLTTGIWVDSLAKITDPGLAVIAPLAFGVAMPVGAFLLDNNVQTFARGVPASISLGIILGGVEGLGVVATQWQYTHERDHDWQFKYQMTTTFLLATGGGVAGYAFGEWLRPDPRQLGFIANGAAWGGISGLLMGAGLSGRDWKDGASIGGMVGYNVGLVGLGALGVAVTPSWQTQKWMWVGYGAGTAAGFLVYPFYLFSDADVKHGLVANAIGGVAGAALAGVLTWNFKDSDQQRAEGWKAPFQMGLMPIKNGAALQAFGEW